MDSLSLSSKPKRRSLVPVIVRAYADEPVELRAIGDGIGYVQVVGQDTSQSIGFPDDRVYALIPAYIWRSGGPIKRGTKTDCHASTNNARNGANYDI